MYENERKEKNSTDPGERLLLELFTSHMIASCLAFPWVCVGNMVAEETKIHECKRIGDEKTRCCKEFSACT